MSSTPNKLPPSHAIPRLVSLDAYRGFTMLAMVSSALGLPHIAKQFPESEFWQEVGRQFEHVEWVGCSLWDLIQPSFMFIVGVSMAFSYAAREARGDSYGQMFRHALGRAVVLTLLGVFLRSDGRGETYWTLEDVLSQIGLGYVFLFLLWGRGAIVQFAAAAVILIGYWALFATWPLPGADFDYQAAGVDPNWEHNLTGFAAHWNKNTNPAHFFDVWLLNLFPRSKPFLYNGGGYQTLSFIPSLATMIFGLLAGELLRSNRSAGQKIAILLVAVVAGLASGWALDHFGYCPIVKRIWTPSWALFSTGWALLFLALFYLVIDVWKFQWWAWPGVIVGMNSIAIYVAKEAADGWIHKTLQTHLGPDVFKLFGETYEPLAQRLAVLVVLWLMCWWMYRRRIFIRI
ncbi:MAG: DUF5009 domain-containing protein [Planctomycetaceae bacterium]